MSSFGKLNKRNNNNAHHTYGTKVTENKYVLGIILQHLE